MRLLTHLQLGPELRLAPPTATRSGQYEWRDQRVERELEGVPETEHREEARPRRPTAVQGADQCVGGPSVAGLLHNFGGDRPLHAAAGAEQAMAMFVGAYAWR